MSLISLNTTPAERMRGCKFADNFFSTARVVENGGAPVGNPTISQGVTLNGTTQNLPYTLAGNEFNSANLSIVCEFWPDFEATADVNAYVYDANGAVRHTMLKTNNASGNVVLVKLGNTTIASIPSSVYSPYWLTGQKNVFVISGTSGNTSAWLNGVKILDADVSAWSPSVTPDVVLGRASSYNGKITKFQVYHALLTEQEAIDLYNDATYDYRTEKTVDLPCDDRNNNAVEHKALDLTLNENDATLGDGVTAALMPTKLAGRGGYEFDGVDDYISGITTPTGSFTVSVMKRVSGVVSITQENDLTTWNLLFAGGGFTGELLSLRVHPSVLTETQLLDEQFELKERLNQYGLPSGLIADLIAEGACTMYHDYRSGSFRDWSENGNTGVPNAATLWNSNGLNFAPINARVVVSDAAELQSVEGSVVFLGAFNAMLGTERYIVKRDAGGIQYDIYTSTGPTQLVLYDGTNTRDLTIDVSGTNYLALNYADGEKCEGFSDGVSAGLFDAASDISVDNADVTIGANVDGANPLLSSLYATLIFNRKLTANEHARLYAELYSDQWPSEVTTKLITDPSEYVDVQDSSLLATYSSDPVRNTLHNLKSDLYPVTLKGQLKRLGFLPGLHNQTDGNSVNTGIDLTVFDYRAKNHTVSGWFKVDSLPANGFIHTIVGRGIGAGSSSRPTAGSIYIEGFVPGGVLQYTHYETGTPEYKIITGPYVTSGVWYHAAYMWDHTAGNVIFYVNGVVIGTASIGTPLDNASINADGFRFFGINSSHANCKDAVDTTLNFFQVHSEAKSAAWVKAEYDRGLAALTQTNYAAQKSIVDVTTGYLGNTPFEVQSGTWAISEDTIDSQTCKVIECVAAGVLTVPVGRLGQNEIEAAFGTWDFSFLKADFVGLSQVFYANADGTTTGAGYHFRAQTSGSVSVIETGVGFKYESAAGLVTAGVWNKYKVTRRPDGTSYVYFNDVLKPADLQGSNPFTDDSTKSSLYLVLDFRAGDKIAFSDKFGSHSIVKRLLSED